MDHPQLPASGHFVLLTTGTSDAFLRGFIFTETAVHHAAEAAIHGCRERQQRLLPVPGRRPGTVWERDDYETDQILNKEAKRRLLHEPGAVARKTAIGLVTFWYEMTDLKNSLVALVLAVGAWALGARRLAPGPA